MEQFTRSFGIVDRSSEIREILSSVYDALLEKGYNPINQIVGYIISEDPSYITNHLNARAQLTSLDRDDLLQELVRSYLEHNRPEK